MIIKLTKEELETLKKRLSSDEAAEMIAENDYVLDVYDFDTPLTMEFELRDDGIDVLACETLEFSDEMNGWYVSEKIKDAELIKKALLFDAERDLA